MVNMTIVKVEREKLQQDYDGFELYYDKQKSLLYSSPKGLARWVDCHPETIKRIMVTLKVGKNAEIPTGKGLRKGTLVTSEEVVQILSEIAKSSRIKKDTRDKAQTRLTLLATLGYELSGMLIVAPEVLAKHAINRVTTVEQLAAVQECTETHAAYLRELFGLYDELKSRGAKGIHLATVNKHNNQLVGIPNGCRPNMSDDEKDKMTLLQLSEKMVLKKTSTANPWQAVNKCKQVGNDFIAFIKGYDTPKLA